MSALGHQQRQVDAVLGEVRQGGVAQLMQRPRGLVHLQRVLLEEVRGSFVGQAAVSGGWALVQRGGCSGRDSGGGLRGRSGPRHGRRSACSVLDAEALTSWLAEHVASIERREPRVREELLARCRAQLIEPPTPDRLSEITRSALHRAEQTLLRRIAARVDGATIDRLEALIAVSDDDDGEDVLALIKAAPGNVSLDTMRVEISKLEAIRAIGLPGDLFADVAPTVVAGWRARAMVESPSHLREHPQPTKLALLCALLDLREREVTDTLAQLLISTIHRINAHAEQKVVAEFVKDFRRVRGKDTMLAKIAEASLRTPDDSVREVIYPVVGGEATLTDLVNEYRVTGTEHQRQKRKVFKASYTNHYRRGLIRLLGVLELDPTTPPISPSSTRYS